MSRRVKISALEKKISDKMEQKQSTEEVTLGPLQAVLEEEGGSSDPEPEASVSGGHAHEETSHEGYWLAHYYTRTRHNIGMNVMAVKYPLHWPKDKAERAAKSVQAGDKYAMPDLPVVIKQESEVIKLLTNLITPQRCSTLFLVDCFITHCLIHSLALASTIHEKCLSMSSYSIVLMRCFCVIYLETKFYNIARYRSPELSLLRPLRRLKATRTGA